MVSNTYCFRIVKYGHFCQILSNGYFKMLNVRYAEIFYPATSRK